MEYFNENNLFRMNFIIQDNVATTLNANLVKIVEAVLLQSNRNELSVNEIQTIIKDNYSLEFSIDEIISAINKKGKNIAKSENGYFLKIEYRKKISQNATFNSEMNKYINLAIEELELDISANDLSKLITNYLYYCFNSNKNTLMALINNKSLLVNEGFRVKEDDVKYINSFLSWNNEGKNRFIFNTLSYCYIYCSLTVKKDNLFAKNLFKGKRFFLDTVNVNIKM